MKLSKLALSPRVPCIMSVITWGANQYCVPIQQEMDHSLYSPYQVVFSYIALIEGDKCYDRQICNIRRAKFPKVKCFSSRLAVVSAKSIEARCLFENEDVVGAATGDAPTTSEWRTILLPTRVHFILQVWR